MSHEIQEEPIDWTTWNNGPGRDADEEDETPEATDTKTFENADDLELLRKGVIGPY